MEGYVPRRPYASALSAPSPRQKNAPPESGVMGGEDVWAPIVGQQNQPYRSVMEGKQLPTLPTEDRAVVNPKFVTAVEAQLNALPAEQRQAALERMVNRPDVYGRAARAIAGRYAAMDKNQTPTARKFDPRLEAQTERFAEQGLQDPESYAKAQALTGRLAPDLQQMTADVVGEKADIEAQKRAQELADAGFTERVGAGARSQFTKAGMGLLQAYADLTGDDEFSKNLNSARRIELAREGAIPQGESIFDKSFQGAMTSLSTQAPLMVVGALTGTAAPVLAQAAIQQFGDAYGEGRAAGLSGGKAALRAVPLAAAEVFFERFGMTKALAGLKSHIAKYGIDSVPKYVAKSIATELPSELATTATQYAIDAMPEIGLNKNPSMADLYKQLEETLRQTILQSGVTAGATIGVTKGIQKTAQMLGPREGAYQRDQSYEGLSEIIARSKGFLAPERQQQQQQKEEGEAPPDLGAVGEARPSEDLTQPPVPPVVDQEPIKTAPEREAAVAQLAEELATTQGIPEADARRMAEIQIARTEQEQKRKTAKLVTTPQEDRILARAQEFITEGVTFDLTQAVQMAADEVQQQDEADALAEKEGAADVRPTITEPSGAGVPMVGQPSTDIAPAGVGVAEPSGMVPAGQDVAEPVGREEGQPPTVTAEEGAPSGVETPEAVQAKAQGQKTTKSVGRPSLLTEEEKKQKLEEGKPIQAAKARAERALTRLTKQLDKLSVALDPDVYASDEAYNKALDDQVKAKRAAIKELLELQADPILRGTKPWERIKAALARPDISERDKANLQAGIDAAKQGKTTGPSASVISKDAVDPQFSKFTNAVQAVTHIIKNGTKFQQTLGKRLRGFVNNVEFVVLEKGQPLPEQLQTPKNRTAWDRSIALYVENYKTNKRVIYVRGESFGVDQGLNNTTVLHELLHAATNRKIVLAIESIKRGINVNNPTIKAAQDLLRTMNSAGRLFNDLARQGKLTKEMQVLADSGDIFDDPREFVAYGLTDPAMQSFLMQAHGYEEDTPFFTRFVQAIRDLFGMGDNDINALTDLIVITDKILTSKGPVALWLARTQEQASGMFGFGKDKEKDQTEKFEGEETTAKPSANVQRLAKMLGNKLYGSPRDIAKVSIKELFQNSFDAVKEAIEKGQMTEGKISIKVDDKDRTIRIVDTGPGMPGEVMGNQFLQIAGTVKGTSRASGGLGVAKMLFLFENKKLEVVSLRDGVVSRMVTTGDDLKAALDDSSRGPKIIKSSDPKTVETYTKTLFPEGHGTAVVVQIPETYEDTTTGEQNKVPFSGYDLEDATVLAESPLFDNIEVTFDRGRGEKVLPIGKNFPIDKYTSFANVRFNWGVARIYVSKDKVDRWGGNTHVLSNGLWQFDTTIKDRPGYSGNPIKRKFFIDVSPSANVKPEDPAYPFELNRQGFSKTANEDFQKIFNYVTAIYSQVDLASEVKNFGTVQYVNPNGTLTAEETLEPKVKGTDNAFTLIKPGDKVEVKDGVMYVNNREIPELTNDDLKNVSVRIDELTIPQNEIDSQKVMIHDNTQIEPSAFDFPDYLTKLGWHVAVANSEWSVTKDDKEYRAEDLNDLKKQMETDGAVKHPSLSDYARKEFGKRYDEYLAEIGGVFQLLRNALVAGGRGEYAELSKEAIGTSIDNEYYGVSIKLPFKGMFINPATTDMRDTPTEIALSMIGTMVHELAHFKQRNHGAEFASEMQRVLTLLKVYPALDLEQVERNLTKHIDKNKDIFDFLNKEFRSGNLKPRGNRFKDASAQQIEDEGSSKSVEGAGGAGEGWRPSLSEISGEGAGSAGQVRIGAGLSDEAEEVGESLRTQKEIEREVQRVGEQFNESQKGYDFGKSVSLLQMAQDPRKVLPVLKALWSRATAAQRSAMAAVVTNDFLADWAGDAVPELQNTTVLLQRMNGMSLRLLKSAGELTKKIERAFRADPSLRSKLDRIAFMSTLAEIDPSNPDAKERSLKLDQMYADLGPEGRRIYNDIKKHFEVLSGYFSQLLDDQITNSKLSLAEQANLMKKVRAMYETKAKISPYFPLVREGDFWLAIGSGKTRKFFMFETAAARDAAMQSFADERIKQKPGESDSEFNKRRAANLEELLTDQEYTHGNDISSLRMASSDSSVLLKEIFSAIEGADLGDAESKDRLKDAVYQVYLQSMPDQSFRRQFIHRKGITGFRPDLLRNVAHTSAKMATQLSRIKYAPLLRNSLSAARDSINNRPRYEPFVNEMSRRVKSALAPEKESGAATAVGLLNKASFIYYLGGASSAMLQPLSIFQTGMPVLSKYGAINATREMGRMLKVWEQFGAYKDNGDGTKSWVAPSVEHAAGLSPEERRAVREMLSRDVTTSTYASSVFDYKSTPTENLSPPIVQFGKDTVDMLVLGGLMHSTERLAREMMFLSAFRLNRQANRTFEQAVDNATVDTNEALGNYGMYNRPVFMKGLAGKTLTQFMMYPLHVTLFMLKNFKEMIKPMKGRTRAEAAKKFFGTLGSSFILAGTIGLPMFSTVMGLLGWAWEELKDDDWPEDLKSMSFELWFRTVWLEEQLGDVMIGGKKLSAIVERGVANALTGLDISGRTGMNNLWLREGKETKGVKDEVMALAMEKAGPGINMLVSWAEGIEAFYRGDYSKGTKKIIPAGFRNFMEAHTLWTEGAKDNKGAKILSKDAFTTGLLIGQAVGFRSDLLANTQYVTFKLIGLEQRINNERSRLIEDIDREFRKKNFKEFNKLINKDVIEFNKRYPTYEITDDQILSAIEKRAEQRAESLRGFSVTDKNATLFSKALRPSRQAAKEAELKGRQK
jgi:hypothetical protein